MQSLVCVCVLVLVGGAYGQLREVLQGLRPACEAEVGLDPSAVENARNSRRLPNDERFKCFLKCMMSNMGAMTPNGDLSTEGMVNLIPLGLRALGAENVVYSCQNQRAADPCETAYRFVQCVSSQVRGFTSGFTNRRPFSF